MKSAGLSSNAGSSAVMFIGPAVRLSPDDFIANSNKTEKNYAVISDTSKEILENRPRRCALY